MHKQTLSLSIVMNMCFMLMNVVDQEENPIFLASNSPLLRNTQVLRIHVISNKPFQINTIS